MTQAANTGSLEQVLRTLQALALSPAYVTELENKVADMVAPFVPGVFRDANGQNFWLTSDGTLSGTSLLIDTEFGSPTGWVGIGPGQSGPGFAEVQITDNLRPIGPLPRLLLIGDRGPAPLGEEREYRVWRYGVMAVAITTGSEPQAVQRDAFVMVDALESLIERNESLGGLVDLITADHPPVAGGYGRIKNAGILAAAMVNFRVVVRRASGL